MVLNRLRHSLLAVREASEKNSPRRFKASHPRSQSICALTLCTLQAHVTFFPIAAILRHRSPLLIERKMPCIEQTRAK